LVDFDGDGRLDILSGSFKPGAAGDHDLYLFRGTEDGGFAAAQKILDADGATLEVGDGSVPFAVDWDGDRDLDLLVGNHMGRLKLFVNEGAPTKPVYRKGQELLADGKVIQSEKGDSGPCVADWDGDGRNDLLLGTSPGSVLFFRNVGTAAKPVLAAGVELVPAVPDTNWGEIHPTCPRAGGRTKVCVADFDGDGRTDLVVGDIQTEDVLRPAMTDAQKALLLQKLAAVEKEYRQLAQVPKDETPQAAAVRTQKIREFNYYGKVNGLREDPYPWLSEAEKPAYDRARSALDELMAQVRRQGGVSHDLLVKLDRARRDLADYRPVQRVYHGFVWLYRRTGSASKQ
jgi:VCBS repeat protein